MTEINATIVGGSGYAGGELVRILLGHPNINLKQVTSRSELGSFVFRSHPNLRGRTKLKFTDPNSIEDTDVLFLCLPHGESQRRLFEFQNKAKTIIDLSADFRLRDLQLYKQWYGEHTTPQLLEKFVYGIPELHREEMRNSNLISSAGCNATAIALALYPLFMENLVEIDRTVAEVKVGSSEAGVASSQSSHHPEKAGSIRSYQPTNHRHTAEIIQELSKEQPISLHMSATSLDIVRGVLATSHVFLKEDLEEKEIWKTYRKYYQNEPFIRLVNEKTGIHRYPDPKFLAGTNYCDIGFERDPNSNRLVVISAIDNLGKGAAGQAVQAMNITLGFDETLGLEFPGLHPI